MGVKWGEHHLPSSYLAEDRTNTLKSSAANSVVSFNIHSISPGETPTKAQNV